MIAFLRGILVEVLPTSAILDVHGVGYEVLMPLSSTSKLPPPGKEVKIFTHLSVREDAQTLYGFSSEEEKKLFELLIGSVSGVGPKLALNVLSGISPEAFRHAVSSGNVKTLTSINGIGKKVAERIVVELKDKMGVTFTGKLPSGTSSAAAESSFMGSNAEDAVSALLTLGYKQGDAQTSVKAAIAMLGAQATTEELIRACLRK